MQTPSKWKLFFFGNDSIGPQEVVNKVEAVEDKAVVQEEEKTMSEQSSGKDDDVEPVLNMSEILQNSEFEKSDKEIIN